MKIKLAQKEDCIGCGACEATCPKKCITMYMDSFGFLYPSVDEEQCIHCNKCTRVCPIINSTPKHELPAYKQYVTWSNDDKVLQNTTSGGVLTMLAKEFIAHGGIVVGAQYNSNMYVEHSIAQTHQDCLKFSGSKYVQSDMTNVLLDINSLLKKKIKVLFIGTPCQVSAVKNFVSDKSGLYTIDFLCHGVPSPGIWEKYVNYLERKYKSKLIEYDFRSKCKGWGKIYTKAIFQNGKVIISRGDCNDFHNWFGKHLSIRESCFNCRYRTEERISDITVADFWKIEKYYSDIPSQQGVSAVIANSQLGMELLNNLINKKLITSIDVTRDSIWIHRKTALSNFSRPNNRDIFVNDVANMSIEKLIKKYPSKNFYRLVIDKMMLIIKGGK